MRLQYILALAVATGKTNNLSFFLKRISNYLIFTEEEVKYMDSMDTLNMRLDALDQLVTQDCRTILGLERQALQEDAEHQRTAPTKEKMLEDDNKKVIWLTFHIITIKIRLIPLHNSWLDA